MKYLMFLFLPVLLFAHPGRVDFRGGHTDSSTGLYHLHTGQEKGMFIAKVVKITDGDTIVVRDSVAELIVRLNGIDAPEMKQESGKESKRFLESVCLGKDVMVVIRDMDRYSRFVSDIFMLDDVMVNQLMVEEGWAWHYVEYSDDKLLANAQMRARSSGRGLWRNPNPVPPWEFRK